MTPRLPILALALLTAACATQRERDLAAGVPVACAGGAAGPMVGDWRLSAFDGEPLTLMRMSLNAEERGFGGAMICNGYGTSGPADLASHYAVADGRLVVAGEVAHTASYCGDMRFMFIEASYLSILQSEPHVARLDDRLCLFDDDGRSLEFVLVDGAR